MLLIGRNYTNNPLEVRTACGVPEFFFYNAHHMHFCAVTMQSAWSARVAVSAVLLTSALALSHDISRPRRLELFANNSDTYSRNRLVLFVIEPLECGIGAVHRLGRHSILRPYVI
ncbi:hypothetical protein EVAR_10213_1 [Eumeta japonica]|uniref:Uncharacterized protein n=1 Tax=Eumeta variegata TaxID=151549 RepID=A0A4C1TDK3_EUMVA|nr:hypothetical protein EVAR_10213_1 [Eumeta japonica]